MKINRFVTLVFFVMLFSLALVASAPLGAVELPQELVDLLSFVVMLAFTALARWGASKLGFDIQDKAAEIASAVSAVLVIAATHYLALLPIQYESFVEAAFAFLTVLFGGNGVYSLLLRNKTRE